MFDISTMLKIWSEASPVNRSFRETLNCVGARLLKAIPPRIPRFRARELGRLLICFPPDNDDLNENLNGSRQIG
jgi:hypothetical protein